MPDRSGFLQSTVTTALKSIIVSDQGKEEVANGGTLSQVYNISFNLYFFLFFFCDFPGNSAHQINLCPKLSICSLGSWPVSSEGSAYGVRRFNLSPSWELLSFGQHAKGLNCPLNQNYWFQATQKGQARGTQGGGGQSSLHCFWPVFLLFSFFSIFSFFSAMFMCIGGRLVAWPLLPFCLFALFRLSGGFEAPYLSVAPPFRGEGRSWAGWLLTRSLLLFAICAAKNTSFSTIEQTCPRL